MIWERLNDTLSRCCFYGFDVTRTKLYIDAYNRPVYEYAVFKDQQKVMESSNWQLISKDILKTHKTTIF